MSTPNVPVNNAVIEESLSSLFHKTAQCMKRSHHFHGRAEHAQMRVLSILHHKGQMNQCDLQQLLGVRSTSLSEILKKLENRGLITRNQDKNDKRSIILTLTEQGATKTVSAATAGHQAIDALFEALSEMEREQLAGILRKVIASSEKHSTGSSLRHCHGDNCCTHGDGHPHK